MLARDMGAVSLILVDRRGDAGFAGAAHEALLGTGLDAEVVRVRAGGRRRARGPSDAVELDASTWWSTVVDTWARRVQHERMVVLDVSALERFRGAAALAGELGEGVDAVAARILESDGETIAFDGGRFDAVRHADVPWRGFVASSLPQDTRGTLWFDRRAFAANR